MKKKVTFNVIMVFIIMGFGINLNSITLKLEKKIQLKDSDKSLISFLSRFSLGNNGEFVFPDARASNIKVFDSKGYYLYTFGRKGHGPGEFITPVFCYKKNNFLWVSDYRANKISQFSIINNKYKYSKDVKLYSLCYDFKIKDNNMYLAGYSIGGIEFGYEFYSKSISNPKKNVGLISTGFKYTDPSTKKKDPYSQYNMSGYFDIFENDAYFVWGAALRIIKINLKDKTTKVFGTKTINYVKPFVSNELKNAYKKRDSKTIRELRKKVSLIGGIFTTPKHLGLVYRGIYDNSLKHSPVFLQFYTYKGKFVEEIKLDEAFGNIAFGRQFYYSKETSKLYFLNREEVEDDDEIDHKYEILVYNLSNS